MIQSPQPHPPKPILLTLSPTLERNGVQGFRFYTLFIWLSRAEPELEPERERERERRAQTQNGKTSVQEDEGKLEPETKASPCNSLINTSSDRRHLSRIHTPRSPLHEISFLRLLEKLYDDCFLIINETGTKLKYQLGTIMGGGQRRW